MPDNGKHLEIAAECWRDGKPLEAGRLIFESLPSADRPKWAARILKLVLEKSGVERSHFLQTLHDAEHPRLWADGHRASDTLGRSAWQLVEFGKTHEFTDEQKLFGQLLFLAKLVARVTYNAADPPDPFDEDNGWNVAKALRYFVEYWNDDQFSNAAWSALCFRNT